MVQPITEQAENTHPTRIKSPARAENQLLVCVAHRHLDRALKDQIRRLLNQDLDWQYLLALANRHGVIPLLYYHLNDLGAGLGFEVSSQLRGRNYEISQSNLCLTGELVKLLDLFNAHGIPAVPFKGPVLSLTAYGDLGLRQFIDLDILVRKKDVLRISEILVKRGFRSEHEFTPAQKAALLRFGCSYTFANDRGVVVDVHWNFAERHFALNIDPEGFWDRLERLSIGDTVLMTLSSEDLLLVLCVHGFTHSWDRLGWICDVAGLIDRQQNIDWDFLVDKATRLGHRRILWLGLFLAGQLLKAPLPQDIWKQVSGDATVTRFGRQLQGQLFTQCRDGGVLAEACLQLSMRERMQDKLKSFFHVAITPRPRDWQLVSLPAGLRFLYYPLRPLRLVRKFASHL